MRKNIWKDGIIEYLSVMNNSKQKAYFLSDLHLGSEASNEVRDIKLRKIDELFAQISSDGSHLFLLGDIFDFWFEYHHAILSDGYELLHRISNLIDNDVQIDFIGGNHDYWAGDFLRRIGINVHTGPFTVEIHGRKLFLAHGDGFAPSDWGYRRLLKPILRNRLNIFLFRSIHPDWALRLGRIASGSSRKITANRDNPYLDEYRQTAKKIIETGYDAVIFGHTHIQEKVEFKGGTYFNLGNFFEGFTYLTLDKDGFFQRSS